LTIIGRNTGDQRIERIGSTDTQNGPVTIQPIFNQSHMASILIVGGAGYIGSHVVKAFLGAGYAVTVLDNLSSGQSVNLQPTARFCHGDIQDRLLLNRLFRDGFDGVVHLAALKAAGESMEAPERYAHQNINGTMNLLEAVAYANTRIVIFSSTAAVYGLPRYLPIDEDHPLEPINFYGFNKHVIEQFLQWYDRLKGIRYACLRYFNAAGYDPDGQLKGLEKNPANLIPVVMEVAAGIRPSMMVFGDDYPTRDGTGIRDYVHVSDLAAAHLKAFEYIQHHDRSLTVNLGTGSGHSVIEVIRMTEAVTEQKVDYRVTERRPGDPAELWASAGRALEVLGWRPEFSDLETLIRSTWQVYRSQGSTGGSLSSV
jgi:UDP-glucose 4-epimerase